MEEIYKKYVKGKKASFYIMNTGFKSEEIRKKEAF